MLSRSAARRALSGALLALLSAPCALVAQDVLTLEEALRQAGVAAPVLAEAEAEIAAARGQARQAAYGPNPELALDVENIAGEGAFRGLTATEYTLAISQRLELGGKRDARRAAAAAQVRAAQLAGALTGAELALAVRERYLAAVAAGARVRLAGNVVDRSRELARIAAALVDAGREPPLRALRANAALAEAEAELTGAEADSEAARRALGASLGLGGGDMPPVTAEFPQIIAAAPPTGSVEALELRLAAAQRRVAEAAVRQEEALRVPDLTVSAGVRRFEETGDQAFVLGAAIPLPLRDRNAGNIAAAQARVAAAAAREARLRAEFSAGLASAAAQYRAASARVETLSQTSLPQAEEALRLARVGYRFGRFTLLDVLDAAAARDAASRALIAAQTDQGVAAARLIRFSQVPETGQ